MSRNQIVVSPTPRGVFLEGVLATGSTPKPGTLMSQKTDGTWEPWNGAADGERDLVCILTEDDAQGGGPDTAYVDSARIRLYVPANGEELLVRVANISGTGDAYAISTKFIIKDGTGFLIITTGTPEMEPFKAREAITALGNSDASSQLCLMQFCA